MNLEKLQKFKVIKSVYIANRTYRFCWQFAIILIWENVIKFVKSVKSLNVKFLNLLNVLWFLLMKPYCLLYIEMIDWNWHLIVSSPSNQKLLVPINQSSYLIYFCYNFFERNKKTNMYEIKSWRVSSQILACFIFLVLFSKKITVSLKK